MKISEIRLGLRNVNLKARVIDISEPREVRTRYGPTLVANAILEDETGKISLTLWGNQIEKVKVGDEIEITNGYVTEFGGELQLNVGRLGKLEVSR